MASITIRKLDEQTKARLRVRAAHHGRSFPLGTAVAQTALRPLPHALAFVSDETDTLDADQLQTLAAKLSEIKKKTNARIFALM